MSQVRAWRKWLLIPIALLVIVTAALWLRPSAKRQGLYPNPQAIPSVADKAAQPQWSAAVDSTRRILRSAIAEQNLPGLSVAVGSGEALVWAEGFGWADFESNLPVKPNTRFRIGTASTILTSAAAGLLLDQGRLKLDEPIQTWVPQFPAKQWPLTLRHLMANVGGVETDTGDDGPLFRQRCPQLVEALPHFAQQPLLFEPGTQYRHSKYGWILVSAAIEAAAKQPLLNFMNGQIFQPLGMDNTGAESAKQENPEGVGEEGEDPPPFTFIRRMILEPLGIVDIRLKPATDPATIYSLGFGYGALPRQGVHVMRPQNLSCYAGSMAYFSTPSDLVRFGLALHAGKLLKPATSQMLQTSQPLTPGQQTGHGLGWDLYNVSQAGQAAGLDGKLRDHTVASFLTVRETGLIVAVMANASYADTHNLALKVAEAFAQSAPK